MVRGMISNSLKKIADYQKKIATLEKQMVRQKKRLLALPGKLGFKSVDELIAALRAAQGGSGDKAAAKPRRKRAKITAETKAQVKKLVEAGKSGSQIAKAVGISLPSVYNIKKALGLTSGK